MANQLFNDLQSNNMMQQFQTFQQNPIQFLTRSKVNVPQQFHNDPHGAVQYLLNNGQMSQAQFNKLFQMAQRMGVKLQ